MVSPLHSEEVQPQRHEIQSQHGRQACRQSSCPQLLLFTAASFSKGTSAGPLRVLSDQPRGSSDHPDVQAPSPLHFWSVFQFKELCRTCRVQLRVAGQQSRAQVEARRPPGSSFYLWGLRD